MTITLVKRHAHGWQLMNGSHVIGWFNMELWGKRYWTPHFTILSEDFKRKGYCTKVVDWMREVARQERWVMKWSGQAGYRGSGYISVSGRAFAMAYSKKRKLRAPKWNPQKCLK
jgi:hypothetical protein